MAGLATLCAILWAATVLGLRSWIHRRRTGRSAIFVVATARRGWISLFAAGLLLAALVGLGLAIGHDWRGGQRLWDSSGWGARGAALATYLTGLAGTFWSQLAMRTSWRIGIDPTTPTELVTDGPFRLVRNPIYAGVILSASALVLALPNGFSLATLALAVLGFELHVRRVEEPHLIATHGARYLAWAARTGRFVPGIGRLERAA